MYLPALVSRSKALAAKREYLAALPKGYVQDPDRAKTVSEVLTSLDKYGPQMPK